MNVVLRVCAGLCFLLGWIATGDAGMMLERHDPLGPWLACAGVIFLVLAFAGAYAQGRQ